MESSSKDKNWRMDCQTFQQRNYKQEETQIPESEREHQNGRIPEDPKS